MSKAKKCDRCGKFYEEYTNEIDEIKFNGVAYLNMNYDQEVISYYPMDLCPECMENFDKWFKERKN